MLYLFYGPCKYLRDKTLHKEVLGVVSRNPGISHKKSDLSEDGEVDDLYNFVVSRGIFDEGKKFAVVSNIDDQITQNQTLQKIIQTALSDNSVILFVSGDWKKKDLPELIKKSSNKKTYLEKYFDQPQKTGLSWKDQEYFIFAKKIATDISKNLNIAIDPQAISNLLIYVEYDLFAFENELIKLSYLKKPITAGLINSLNEYSQKHNFWDLSKDLLQGIDARSTMIAFEKIIQDRIDLFMVFNYIAKSTNNSKLTNMLALLDRKIKAGRMDIDQAVLNIALK